MRGFAPPPTLAVPREEFGRRQGPRPIRPSSAGDGESAGVSRRRSPKGGELGVDDNNAVSVGPQEQIGGLHQIDGDERRQGRPRREARSGAGPGIFGRGGLGGLELEQQSCRQPLNRRQAGFLSDEAPRPTRLVLFASATGRRALARRRYICSRRQPQPACIRAAGGDALDLQHGRRANAHGRDLP